MAETALIDNSKNSGYLTVWKDNILRNCEYQHDFV